MKFVTTVEAEGGVRFPNPGPCLNSAWLTESGVPFWLRQEVDRHGCFGFANVVTERFRTPRGGWRATRYLYLRYWNSFQRRWVEGEFSLNEGTKRFWEAVKALPPMVLLVVDKFAGELIGGALQSLGNVAHYNVTLNQRVFAS